jgi:hypothetical protein
MSREAGSAQGDWRSRVTSAAQAVSVVRPGDYVFVGSACAVLRRHSGTLAQGRASSLRRFEGEQFRPVLAQPVALLAPVRAALLHECPEAA